MYVPSLFQLDPAEIPALVAAWPFATLVTGGSLGLYASHVPLVLREGRLIGHLARANPQVADLDGDLLAIFHGPHAMVHSDWYAEPPRQVPTWNYLAVHATGRAAPVDGLDAVRIAMAALQPGTAPGSAPEPGFVERLSRGVVGFAIEVARWEGKAKVSQNRDPEDRERVRAALADHAIGRFQAR